jgi:hypothetical protein
MKSMNKKHVLEESFLKNGKIDPGKAFPSNISALFFPLSTK